MAEEQSHLDVKLEWNISDKIVPHYATNLTVQTGENEIIVSFFRTLPPLLVGTAEEVQQQLAGIKSVKAECIAQVIVSPSRMQEFIGVMQTGLTNYIKAHSEGYIDNVS